MNRHCAVAQHGFRPGRGDRDIITLLAERHGPVFALLDIGIGGPARERVFEVPHVAVDFGAFDLKIRDRGLKMRIPVDQPFATIDQTFVVHLNKNFDHGIVEIALFASRRAGCARHGERVARPVAGRAEPL